MNPDRPKVSPSQVVWIVACVVLLTSLFLIGAWLFRPDGSGPGEAGVAPGGVTEQELTPAPFTPEGQRPEGAPPAPPQPEAAPIQGEVPTPPALASRLPSQMAREASNAPVRTPEAASPPERPAEPEKVQPKAPEPNPKPAPQAPTAEAKPPAKPAAEAPKEAPRPSAASKSGTWSLQVAAVSDRKGAKALQDQLKAKGFPPSSIVEEGGFYKIRIAYKDEAGARSAQKKLSEASIKDTAGAFVVAPGR